MVTRPNVTLSSRGGMPRLSARIIHRAREKPHTLSPRCEPRRERAPKRKIPLTGMVLGYNFAGFPCAALHH